jgi:hypothetical protein
MFYTLLATTFAISLVVSVLTAWLFNRPVTRVIQRIVRDEIASAWSRYIRFAVIVVGIGSGVHIRAMERFLLSAEDKIVALTPERWTLEVLRAVIGSLGGIAWMLLVFFLFALVAYVVVRFTETRNSHKQVDESQL